MMHDHDRAAGGCPGLNFTEKDSSCLPLTRGVLLFCLLCLLHHTSADTHDVKSDGNSSPCPDLAPPPSDLALPSPPSDLAPPPSDLALPSPPSDLAPPPSYLAPPPSYLA
jgi:hypothetical protein